MSRLTELIDIDGMKIKTSKERPLSNQGLGEILHKLYKLEDLEDELVCPLEVVFKVLKERYVIFKHTVGLDNPEINLRTYKVLGLICVCGEFGLELCDGVFGDEFYVDTKYYGKTWWLKGDKQ